MEKKEVAAQSMVLIVRIEKKGVRPCRQHTAARSKKRERDGFHVPAISRKTSFNKRFQRHTKLIQPGMQSLSAKQTITIRLSPSTGSALSYLLRIIKLSSQIITHYQCTIQLQPATCWDK